VGLDPLPVAGQLYSLSTSMLFVGSFDLYNCLPDNLYCVGGDVKPCCILSSLYYAIFVPYYGEEI